MKKRLWILLTFIMIISSISGCSLQSNSSSNKDVKILLSISDASDNFRKLIVSSAESYAKSINTKLDVRDAAGSIEKQVEHMKEAVSGGYDSIICAPVNADTALQLKKAAQGIPIVFMNSRPDDSLLEKDKYIYVASNEESAGQYQAEYIQEYLKNKKDLKVILLKGEKGHAATNGRTKAVKESFKNNGIQAEYVFEDNAVWSIQKAKDMLNIFLSTGNKFDCIIANNDDMALGAIEALKENKIDPSSIPIVGIDATEVGLKSVVDGDMKLTVYQPAKGQSESAIDAAVNIASGHSISKLKYVTEDEKFIWVPFEKVDKSNVSKYMK
jgi:inositol transport system substrate-binding protein